MPNPNNCLRYWDLADHIRIDHAIALWCGVEPAQVVYVKLCKKVIMVEVDRIPDQAASRSISFFCSTRSVMFR